MQHSFLARQQTGQYTTVACRTHRLLQYQFSFIAFSSRVCAVVIYAGNVPPIAGLQPAHCFEDLNLAGVNPCPFGTALGHYLNKAIACEHSLCRSGPMSKTKQDPG